MKNSQNAKKSNGLSPSQVKAATLLVSGMSATNVAKEIGVHPSTISVWKIDPQFESTMNVLLREQRDACKEKLRALGHDALSAIEEIMKNAKTPAKDRLTAALKIVEMLGIEDESKTRIGKLDIDYANFDVLDNTDHEKQLELKDLGAYLENDFEEVEQ